MSKDSVARFLSLWGLVLALGSVARAQVVTGTPPFGSFVAGPDVINLANLNSQINIPIFSKSGRGLSLAFNLTHDSSIWYPVGSSGSGVWQPVTNWGWNASEADIGYVTFVSGLTTQIITCGKLQELIQKSTFSGFIYHDGFATPHPFPGTSTSTTNQCTGQTT